MGTRIKKLPYHWYALPHFLIVVLGIIASVYLSISHYKNYTDPTYSSFCAISQTINCDTVAQSPWSVVFGLPVSLWGVLGYLFYGQIISRLLVQKNAEMVLWSLPFYLALTFSVVSCIFAYISTTQIKAFCIVCIGIYAINFALLFSSWLICRRFDISLGRSGLVKALKQLFIPRSARVIFTVSLVVSIALVQLFPHYWELESVVISNQIKTGITENGHPWIGAEKPLLVIEEYSDYQCFHCYNAQRSIRQLINQHPEKIRLIHRHYPMDHTVNKLVVPTPFHVGSAQMALMAIYATQRGYFWEINDILFEKGRSKKPFNSREIALAIGMKPAELSSALSDPETKARLNYDILSGLKRRIIATPSFVIEDQVYTGSIPAQVINKAME